MIVRSLLLKSRKKLAHNVFDTSAADVGLVRDITDTDRWAQDGSIMGPEIEWKKM